MTRLTILLTLACLPFAAMADPTAEAAAAVEAWTARFQAAVDAEDAAAVAALYAEDADVLWVYEGEEAHGRPAIEALFARVIAEYPGTTATSTTRSVHALGDGAVAIHEVLEIRWRGPDGSEQMEINRGSSVYRPTADGLECVIDHTSIPIRWVPPAT
ncbi:MAG TPA: SgcJ/EcaC family oxidoreductase [Pseudomonadales bacterium]|nr:SgcJ/EcaC family oxidoreductase [Pseudomonadales bacterium]